MKAISPTRPADIDIDQWVQVGSKHHEDESGIFMTHLAQLRLVGCFVPDLAPLKKRRGWRQDPTFTPIHQAEAQYWIFMWYSFFL